MKKILLLGATALFFTSLSFAQTQTGKDDKAKAKDSVKAKTMKPCPGKTCGKKKN